MLTVGFTSRLCVCKTPFCEPYLSKNPPFRLRLSPRLRLFSIFVLPTTNFITWLMKKLELLLFLTFLFLIGKAHSQNCIPSVIIFTTQQQVDDFPSTYPGCTIIDGNVGVAGNDITNLDSLIYITEIKGSMQLGGSVSDISGLSNLIKIGGSLTNNQTSAPIIFPSLFVIGGNFNSTSWSPEYSFPDLDSLKGNFTLYHLGNTSPDINFNNLEYVNDVTLRGYIADFNFFAELDTIFGDLRIDENTVATTINGFQALKVVQGVISIHQNSLLQSLNGFNALLT